jgi:hypothetical protein
MSDEGIAFWSHSAFVEELRLKMGSGTLLLASVVGYDAASMRRFAVLETKLVALPNRA